MLMFHGLIFIRIIGLFCFAFCEISRDRIFTVVRIFCDGRNIKVNYWVLLFRRVTFNICWTEITIIDMVLRFSPRSRGKIWRDDQNLLDILTSMKWHESSSNCLVSNIFLHFRVQSENKSHSLLALQKTFFVFVFVGKKLRKRSKSYQDYFCNTAPFCNRCGMRVEW